MPLYKNVQIDAALHGVIRHMASVEEYRETLQALQGVWDNLSLLGQLSGTGTDMSGTREAFQKLTGSLLNNLTQETLKKAVLEMKSKAQVAIDIMVRNLYERTADIGFLATDEDIRAYLVAIAAGGVGGGGGGGGNGGGGNGGGGEEDANLAAARTRLEARFKEYVRKYSVYSDIILLLPNGRVVAKLDPNNPVIQSHDPLIMESLRTSHAYVETARATDLQANESAPLIYSYRVTGRDGSALGVLCLCFRFIDETKGIFANLIGADDWSVLTLLDPEGQVMASSDNWHVPVGARVQRVLQGDSAVVRFAGREYLATTRPTQGYQGYFGPGWYGHVMLPLEHAFDQTSSRSLDKIDATVLAGVMTNSALFAAELQAIPAQAEQIQRVLNRSVWNGNVRHRMDDAALNPAFSKVLLWEISNTGLKTKDVFERSIGNLQETVISTLLENNRFLASLAIDIMDRNLYERANDCRWWALTSAFRDHLAHGSEKKYAQSKGQQMADLIGPILTYINGLYTVYDNLLVFDRYANVIAVSNSEYADLIGQTLTESWVKQTLMQRDSQSYSVSGFMTTPLYRNRPSYIYAAAIRSSDSKQVVGGIAIVFDAEPQFDAMLRDALPRDTQGKIVPGSFGVFACVNRSVIASTRADLKPGSLLDIPQDYFRSDEGQIGIIVFEGHYYAVGSSPSKGYREFKGETDAYQNDVSALIFAPLGKVNVRQTLPTPQFARMRIARSRREGAGEVAEIATFHVAGQWLGIYSHSVIEAIEAHDLTSVPGARRNLFGYAMFRSQVLPVINLSILLGVEAPVSAPGKQIVILKDKKEGEYIGLLVDYLGEIPEVPVAHIEKLSTMMGGANQLADSMVKHSDGEPGGQMLVLLSVERIHARLQTLHALAEANEAAHMS
jgi:chemotaxis signal transduction protein